MKKILLILLTFLLTTAFFITIPKAKAETIDITEDWHFYKGSGKAHYNIEFHTFISPGTTSLDITLPASNTLKLTDTVDVSDFSDVWFYGNGIDPISFPLSDYTDFTSSFVIHVDFVTGLFEGEDISSYEMLVRVDIETSIATWEYWENQWWYLTFLPSAPVYILSDVIEVRYYVGGSLYFVDFVYDQKPDILTPEIPVGYTFIGWQTVTGELFRFGMGYLDPDLLTGVDGDIFELFAYYVSTSPINDNITEPTPNAPDFIAEFMDVWGANNTAGYTTLYVIILLLIVAGMALLHVNYFATVILAFIWTAACMFFGVLPTWLIAGMLLTFVSIAIKVFSGNTEEGGQNE